MGPAVHVSNPSGPSDSLSVSSLLGFTGVNMAEVSRGGIVCERSVRKTRVGAPSLWGPQFMLPIRAGHQKHSNFPSRLGFAGVNMADVSSGSLVCE